MSQAPVLVLQMQRMGDLILSFPLLALLQQRYPGHPLWTVAEPRFFQHLYGLSPSTVFFPPEAQQQLQSVHYRAIVNLSHRADAAAIAGSLDGDVRFGAHVREGNTYIDGYWSLYRASIVQNNRYNRFHWGDLQLLDHVEDKLPQFSAQFGAQFGAPPNAAVNDMTSPPNPQATVSDRVGIVVGASEKEKRLSPAFFGALGKALLRKGLRPVFLGGPDDAALGQEAQRISGLPQSNLCGRFSVGELAEVLRGLALCITPDTGPMHLATWVGTPVLNLSLGPVSAWETGPQLPGHYVLRARLSCTGCWRCTREHTRCHDKFHASRVASVVHTLLHEARLLPELRLPGLSLSRTARDTRGLYQLLPVTHGASGSPVPPLQDHTVLARTVLARFWQEWFWSRRGSVGKALPPACTVPALCHAVQTLTHAQHGAPLLARHVRQSVLHLSREVSRHMALRLRSPQAPLPPDFWHKIPPLLRPFSGHMHLRLQNAEYAPAAWEAVLSDVEALAGLVIENT